jgi:hypothetical protein
MGKKDRCSNSTATQKPKADKKQPGSKGRKMALLSKKPPPSGPFRCDGCARGAASLLFSKDEAATSGLILK